MLPGEGSTDEKEAQVSAFSFVKVKVHIITPGYQRVSSGRYGFE
jgi:hypothetical protein